MALYCRVSAYSISSSQHAHPCNLGPVVQSIISLTKVLVSDLLSLLECIKSGGFILFCQKI